MDTDIYSRIVEQHKATRPSAVSREEHPDYTLPEDVGRERTDVLNSTDGDARGTGTGSIREAKTPDIS